MDPRRLELLLALSRLGSMRAVADELGTTTSTVSQQLAVLAREAGTPLVEPQGRRVRLTPAGTRLAGHAVTVLAALEAARADLDPTAAPAGTVRVAAFATAVRQALLPAVRRLGEACPEVRLQVHEHEPPEALALLGADQVDLALTYDYDFAPASFDAVLAARAMGATRWGLGVPADNAPVAPGEGAVAVVARYREHDWIVNSRNTADTEVVRTLASLAGYAPSITHHADSLDLVQDMITAGMGVGLLPVDQPVHAGVRVLALADPVVTLRAFAVVRRGREQWPPLALVLDELAGVELR